VITLVGLLAVPNMAVARFPDLAPPTVVVTANYPGADAATVEKTVATLIEREVNGVENMIYLQSKSSSDGNYSLTVSFEVGTNVDLAAVDVQNRVSRANANLPAEVIRNGITVVKQSTQILMLASVTSPNKTYDKLYLSNYVTLNMIEPITRVPGVGGAELRIGAAPYSMRMWIEPAKLRQFEVTATDITAAIREQNLQAPAGTVGSPPQASGLAFQYPVTVRGQLETPEEFGNIVVKRTENGTLVRMRDIARIDLGSEAYDSFGRRNGEDQIPILIYQRPGANALSVAKAVEAELAVLAENFPEDMEYHVSFDTTLAVDASVDEVVTTLTEAFVLVVLVVFTFLGNFRATVIPLLAVPVSLIGTFAVLYALGFSINTLTLFGMVLAIGIVVDDAIVVVEAVEHHIEQGMTPLQATERAMAEVSGPVVAIALVLCSVFVPVAFLGGVTGQLYRQFAVTLSASVILSAIVALTLTPALCQMILRPRTKMWGPFGWYIATFEKAFGYMVGGYSRLAALSVRRLFLSVGLMLVVFAGTGFLHKTLPTGFIPPEDNGYLLVSISLPPGSSLERTDAVCRKMEKIMMETPGVSVVNMLGGINILAGNRGPNYATVFIIMKPWDERDKSQSATAIQGSLMQKFSALPEVQAQVINPPAVPGLGFAGGFVFELQDRSGQSPQALDGQVQAFLSAARQSQLLSPALFSPFSTLVPQVFLDIDRDKAKTLGIAIDEIFTTLQVNLSGSYVNLFTRFGRTWRVYVQSEAAFRRTPDDIGNLQVRSEDGDMVPLSTLTKVNMTTGPDLIMRYNLFRAAEIYGSAKPGVSSGAALAEMERLAKDNLPRGWGYEWTGTAYQEKESSSKQSQILGLALIFVFLFLAAQYESWAVPFSILIGLPTGIFGAYLGTMLFGADNNVYVQIGIITLLGLAAKNAILIVEFAKEKYDKEGLPLREAALEGAKLRFRPILMTSFAFILGVLPLALSDSGAGAAGQKSLGVAVVSGMTMATLLGVFVIPALYVLVQGAANTFSGNKSKGRDGLPKAGQQHSDSSAEH
jgi:HAE1 family hydrophobic/amphiphilic exporter-1/multidrug efflux pump